MKTAFTRRDFFRGFPFEITGIAESLRGCPDLKLSELGTLPDAELGALIPVIAVDGLTEEDGRLWRIDGPVREELAALSPERRAVLARFDGTLTLRLLAAEVARETGTEETAAFREARELFLTLADKGAALPCNAPA